MASQFSQRLSNASTEVPPTCPRLFQITRSVFSYDFESLTDDRVFHGKNSTLNPGKPDLILCRGNDAKGRAVAACSLKHTSSDVEICVGDPTNDGGSSVKWEKLNKKFLIKTQYVWETNTAPHHSGEAGARSLVWKRTHSVGVEDCDPSTFGSKSLKLVDEETDEILAVFSSAKSWAGCGKLEIRADFGEDFDLMVMIACIALFEKAFRNSMMASNGSGGFAFGSGAC